MVEVATTDIGAILDVGSDELDDRPGRHLVDRATGPGSHNSESKSVAAAKQGLKDYDSTKISKSDSGPPKADDPVPTNIQSFRTISQFLSQLQVKQQSQPSQSNTSRETESELKVADAFAHVSVINHDVIAYSASRALIESVGLTAVIPDTSPPVAENDGEPAPETQLPPAEQSTEQIGTWKRWVTTRNTRESERGVFPLGNTTGFPRLLKEECIELGGKTLNAYLKELQGNW